MISSKRISEICDRVFGLLEAGKIEELDQDLAQYLSRNDEEGCYEAYGYLRYTFIERSLLKNWPALRDHVFDEFKLFYDGDVLNLFQGLL